MRDRASRSGGLAQTIRGRLATWWKHRGILLNLKGAKEKAHRNHAKRVKEKKAGIIYFAKSKFSETQGRSETFFQ